MFYFHEIELKRGFEQHICEKEKPYLSSNFSLSEKNYSSHVNWNPAIYIFVFI